MKTVLFTALNKKAKDKAIQDFKDNDVFLFNNKQIKKIFINNKDKFFQDGIIN